MAPKAAPINAMTTTASLLCKAERLLEANGLFDQDRKQYNEKGPLKYECKQYDLAVALRCIALPFLVVNA